MSESSEHPYVEWIAREAKRPVATDPAARARVMAAVRAYPVPRRSPFAARLWSRVIEPRVFRLSPVTSGLLAAGLVGFGVLAGGFANNWGVRTDGRPLAGVAPQPPVSPPGSSSGRTRDTVVKFVFVGPGAAKVSLVGDFNDWDKTKTPMVRAADSGLWTVTLPLAAGRHQYAFIVDGSNWANDPAAPLAPDDGFGHASSVKNVPGPSL